LDGTDLARAASTSDQVDQSPAVEEKQDEDTYSRPHHNVPTKRARHILELSSFEDDDIIGQAPVQKKVQVSTKKKVQSHHRSPTVEEDEDDREVSDIRPQKKVRVGTKKKNQSHRRSPAAQATKSNGHRSKKSTGQSKKSSTRHKNSDDSEIEVIENPRESPEQELGMSIWGTKFKVINLPSPERFSKTWNSPIYAFFEPRPRIAVVKGRRCHEFICSALDCKGNGPEARVVRRFLDTADKGSTSNMRKHAKHCWSDDIIKKADEAKEELTLDDFRKSLAEAKKTQDGSITAFFDRQGKNKLKYMMLQHTYEEARSVLLEIMKPWYTY
jgi:hypothetical protein